MGSWQGVLEGVFRVGRSVIERVDRGRLPVLDGEVRLSGLSAPVEVVRDPWGVPHLRGQTAEDLFLAQGYVHCQDRLGQMEMGRRFGLGRLSEWFGSAALPADRASRVLGFLRTARVDLAGASPALRSVLEAYCRGVNAYLQDPGIRPPLELVLAGWRPEPWTPLDCLAWGRVMYWQLCRGWSHEVVRAMLIQAAGPEVAEEWDPQPVPGEIPHLPSGIEIRPADLAGLVPGQGPASRRGMGSNAFVISPAGTRTGGVLLGNDMHMPLMLPSFWYENHLSGGGIEVTGVSLPGLPMVLVGHNDRVAWGCTLAHTDVEDTFVERADPEDPDRFQVPGGGYEPAEVLWEEIRVRGRRRPHREKVVITRHGPIISGVFGGVPHRLSLCSTALQPSQAAEGFLRLNLARNHQDFEEALRFISTPALNIVYGDVEGNIAYRTAGLVPIRASGKGDLPSEGWTGAGDWQGFVPFEEMPHAKNPSEGYVVSCNHAITGPDHPHFLGRCFMPGTRARRLHQLIRERWPLSQEDCRDLQADEVSLQAPDLLALLADLPASDPDVALGLSVLRGFQGDLRWDSSAAALYAVFRHRLARRLLQGVVPAPLVDRALGQGFDLLTNITNEFYAHDTGTLLRVLGRDDSRMVQAAGGRRRLLTDALRDAVGEVRQHLGPDPARWRWGDLHGAIFQHFLGDRAPLDRLLNLGPFPVGGDADTPNQHAMLPDRPFHVRAWAPTFRQVVDLADLSRSVVIHAPGQSEHPASPHYRDLLGPWLQVRHHPMLWTRDQVETHARHRLQLRPA